MPTDATVNSASTIAHNATQNFRRYWAGEGSLADAYWGYGFGGGWILALLLFLIGLALFPSAVTHYNAALASPVFRGYLVFARLTLFAYQAIVCILIWRNARMLRLRYGNTSLGFTSLHTPLCSFFGYLKSSNNRFERSRGRAFVEPKRGSMIGINQLRLMSTQPRVAQPHR
jgi:hypothetical protein